MLIATLVVVSGFVPLRAFASPTDDALALVDLYYTMQGTSAVSDDQRDAGLIAALELMATGYDVAEMTDLVVQVHREIPGASTQPFELIFPAFVRATAVPGTGGGATRGGGTATTRAAAPTRTSPNLVTPTLPPVNPDVVSLRTKGRAGMIVAVGFDLVGYALFLASSAASSAGFGVVGVMMVVGSTLATTGAIIGTATMSTRHRAHVKAGYRPSRRNMGASWTLTGISIALGIAAWTLPLIGGVIAGGVVLILEGINMLSVRPKWDQDLAASAAVGRRPAPVAPMTAVLPGSSNRPAIVCLSMAF